ncbi:hypothetical protein [Homoserinibacter sp. GY 40078]|uniref:hypothetical protein n=1 Tax=Homoserinibacter sp. GY 40078 TaxID=2603275 RepID=UPI0011CCDA22|nr:hypothetical protein [Homoserinibacter sp. GY 40078]TXK16293.1 hypothetical protein FVQ89_13630 [Homoserinibacter sp. GY 40078]
MTEPSGGFPAPSWAPPPREPFLPLRPLTLGQIIGGGIRALRHNPQVTMGPAILLSLVATLGSFALSDLLAPAVLDALGSRRTGAELYGWLNGFGAGLLVWVSTTALGEATAIVQRGLSAAEVAHAVVGRRLTVRGLRRRTRGALGRTIGWAVLVFAVLVLGGLTGAFVLASAALANPVAAVIVTVVLYPGATVLLVWLGTRLAFVPQVLVVERLVLARALRRAWGLTRGSGWFWRVFGIRLLVGVMIAVATSIVTTPVQLLGQWLGFVLAGNGDEGDLFTISEITTVVAAIVVAVISAVALVIVTSTDAVLYLDQRMRREGLDLMLARFMETRRPSTHFDPTEADPYRSPDTAPTSQTPAARAATTPEGATWS